MCKHLSISTLICLLILLVGSQHASAQSQLARDAYAIFEGSCLICHGPDGVLSRIAPHGTRRAHCWGYGGAGEPRRLRAL